VTVAIFPLQGEERFSPSLKPLYFPVISAKREGRGIELMDEWMDDWMNR
jgi:hypothetical protein